MVAGWDIGLQILSGLGFFLLNPFMYLFVLFIYLHYRRQMNFERQLFSVRIQSPFVQTLRAVGMGLVGGLLVALIPCPAEVGTSMISGVSQKECN